MPKITKIQIVRDLLSSETGATLEALCAATGWQSHSVRAALSSLRKDGTVILREASEDAERPDARYCITAAPEASA